MGLAQERKATPAEAIAMVRKAVAAIQRDGAAEVEPKHMYCETLADSVICAGVYK